MPGMSAALLLLPSLTVACTVCNTDTGQQVRGGIFGDDFWSTLLAVASPFPILLLALAAIHLGLPTAGSTQSTPPDNGTRPTE